MASKLSLFAAVVIAALNITACAPTKDTSATLDSPTAPQTWEQAGAVRVTVSGVEDCNLGIIMGRCPVISASSNESKIGLGRALPFQDGRSLRVNDAIPEILPGLNITAPFSGLLLRIDIPRDELMQDGFATRFILVADAPAQRPAQTWEQAGAVRVSISGVEDCNLGIIMGRCPVVASSSDTSKVRVGRIRSLEDGRALQPGQAIPRALRPVAVNAPFNGLVLRVDVPRDQLMQDGSSIRYILVADGLAADAQVGNDPVPSL